MTELKELRLQKKLTQREAAERIGISLRSYVTYENEESRVGTPKYRFLLSELKAMNRLDESHGVLEIDEIRELCKVVFDDYNVSFCYLFGSYAKGRATETSDIDLLVGTETTGLRYYEMAERLRQALHKKIDLLDVMQLINNKTLIEEILKEGVRIYE